MANTGGRRGSVRKDPRRGTWTAVVHTAEVGSTARQQVRRRGFATEREAQRALTTVVAELDQGTYVRPGVGAGGGAAAACSDASCRGWTRLAWIRSRGTGWPACAAYRGTGAPLAQRRHRRVQVLRGLGRGAGTRRRGSQCRCPVRPRPRGAAPAGCRAVRCVLSSADCTHLPLTALLPTSGRGAILCPWVASRAGTSLAPSIDFGPCRRWPPGRLFSGPWCCWSSAT